ncbi:MAG TPA: hypothetical protein VMS73_09345 [Anaerolineaceae bacterium]|nr:hypothetical protein [Anaerolineaceae bacterium]
MRSLEEIHDYLFCSLFYYLKHQSPLMQGNRPGQASKESPLPSVTTLDLPGMALSQALAVYAGGKYPQIDFTRLVSLVWEAWWTQKKLDPQGFRLLSDYAQYRKNILEQFLSGKIQGKDHQPYKEPRMSRRYQDMLETAGLTRLAGQIDESGLSALGCVTGEMPGMGKYGLADAYSDSLHMAALYPPPLQEVIYGIGVPTILRLVSGDTLAAKADLVILEKEATLIEVHDFSPSLVFPRTWVGRKLEVIAAFYMEAADPAKPFPQVEKVVYRHWMSGKTVERRQLREARLIFALEAAKRGIQAGIYLPQFLSGDLSRCRQCPAQEVCIPASGDLMEWFLPGEAEYSQQLKRFPMQ